MTKNFFFQYKDQEQIQNRILCVICCESGTARMNRKGMIEQDKYAAGKRKEAIQIKKKEIKSSDNAGRFKTECVCVCVYVKYLQVDITKKENETKHN